MSLGCFSCRNALAAIQAGQANDAVRLEVEAHLSTCQDCRDEQARWAVVGELKAAPTQRLSTEARERVRRAMMSAALEAEDRAVSPTGRRWQLAFGGAFVAAALLVVAGGMARLRPTRVAEVVSGELDVAGVTARAGTAITDGQELTTGSGTAVVRLDGPVVRLGTGTRASWRRSTHTLDLRGGQVTVEVEPNKGLQFRVATSRFAAEVVGTRFEVTESSVATQHGKVRVVDPQGRELALVSAGQRWTWPAPVPPPPVPAPVLEVAAAAAAAPAVAPAPVPPHPVAASASEATPPVAQGRLSPALRPSRSSALPEPAVSPERALLSRAQRAASDGNNGEVRTLISELLMGHPTARIDAEAGLLLGDAARNEGHRDEALRRYRDVIDRHGNLPAAETALFFIAQLQVEMGRHDDARRTLQHYVGRYPDGTFLAEARTHLSHLDAQ